MRSAARTLTAVPLKIKLGRLVTVVFVIAVLTAFSYLYVKYLYTTTFVNSKLAAFIILSIVLLFPLTSFSYVFFRLRARETQLKDLFTLPGILKAYLNSKGEYVKQHNDESPQEYHERLERIFDSIFETEMKGEYGRVQYLCGIFLASGVTILVLHYLATSSFGSFLAGSTAVQPTPVQMGLLGAFAWNLWLLLNNYEKLDLPPSTFYWMAFRYVIGVVAGLVANQVIKTEYANIFALVIAAIPYPTLLEFLRSKIAVLKEAHSGEPQIWKIQGMPQSTIDRLATLGIHTTQEMAYSDPLMLLFRTNFQPKIVIDWIDQCLAYDYFGEHLGDNIKLLRVRGIRGSIELSGLKDDDPALPEIADVLGVKPAELKYFRNKLLNDYQLKLITTLWDQFQPQQSEPDEDKEFTTTQPLSQNRHLEAAPETAAVGATTVVANVPMKASSGNGEHLVPPDQVPKPEKPA